MARHKKKKKAVDNLLNSLDDIIVQDDSLDETITSEELGKQIEEALNKADISVEEVSSADKKANNSLQDVSNANEDEVELLDVNDNLVSDFASEEDDSINNNTESEDIIASTEDYNDSDSNDVFEEEENAVESVSYQENNYINEKDSDVNVDKNNKSIDLYNSSKEGRYISFEYRVIKVALLLVLSFALTLFFTLKSFSMTTGDAISYNEKSNLDYQVYLKANNFYEADHLGKDMLYVANLIDHINVDFDYIFSIDKMVDLDLTYDVVAKLRITDNSEKNLFFEKEYVLMEPVTEKIGNSSSHNIKKSINIDYNYYNALANNFRTSYGLDTKSNLFVYFRVKQDNSKYDLKYPIQGNSEMLINIPLSEKAISVKMDYKEVNENKQILATEHLAVTNYFFILLAIICFIGIIYFTIKLIRLIRYTLVKKSSYDKYVSKILKEYDRLIVETETGPIINDNTNVIKVSKFQELLDVRDNLKLPIKYFVVTEHQKCDFFISHEEELYLLTIKEVDLENNNKES